MSRPADPSMIPSLQPLELRAWPGIRFDSRRSLILAHVGFVLVYALSQWVGYQLKYGPDGFSIMWPGLGLLGGTLAVLAPRQWPAVLLLAALTEATTTRLIVGGEGLSGWIENGVFVGSNLLSAIAFAAAVRWFVRRPDPLNSVPAFGFYVIVAVGLTAAIAAAITTPLLGRSTVGYASFDGFRTFWISNVIGTLVVATPILVIASGGRIPRERVRRIEGASLLAIAGAVTFAMSWVQFRERDLDYFADLIYLPFLAWALVRFGAAMLTAVSLVMATVMVSAMSMELGPFVVYGRPSIESVTSAQAFILPSLIAILTVGALFEQRRHQEERIRAAEQHLRQLETLDAIGTMASGVAHDFGNLAIAVQTAQTTLRAQLKDAPPAVRQSVEQLGAAATQAQSLSQSLMVISREDDEGLIETLDVIDSVEMAREALAPMLEHTRRFRVRMPGGPIPIRGRQGDLARAISSLVINARDATAERGNIAVSVVRRDDRVRVTVADDGRGIPDEVQERVLDPFFTTKPRGTGTGLGLASVAGIVRDMGGSLEITSRDGQGTRVTLDLPIDGAEPTAGADAAARVPGQSDVRPTRT